MNLVEIYNKNDRYRWIRLLWPGYETSDYEDIINYCERHDLRSHG